MNSRKDYDPLDYSNKTYDYCLNHFFLRFPKENYTVLDSLEFDACERLEDVAQYYVFWIRAWDTAQQALFNENWFNLRIQKKHIDYLLHRYTSSEKPYGSRNIKKLLREGKVLENTGSLQNFSTILQTLSLYPKKDVENLPTPRI